MELIISIFILFIFVGIMRLLGAWMLRIDEVIKNQKIMIKVLISMNEKMEEEMEEVE